MKINTSYTLDTIPDDILLSLTEPYSYFGKHASAVEVVRDTIYSEMLNSRLSSIMGGWTVLNDRFPTFGKEKNLFTKDFVGYNDPRKRVTIPTFDIVCEPSAPAPLYRNATELRRVFKQSVEAMDKAELGFLTGLLDCIANYNACYPRIKVRWEEVTPSLLAWAASPMRDLGVEPIAVFTNATLSTMVLPYANALSIPVVQAHTESVIDIVGQCTNPDLTTVQLVDNGFKLKVNCDGEPGARISFRHNHNVGFLVSQAMAVRITMQGELPDADRVKAAQDRIRAFVVGEDGGSAISIL